MKAIKRILSIALVVMMMTAMMVVPTNAAGYSITVKNSNHIFEAYQIFSGTLHEGVLNNVKWGSGIGDTNGAALIEALKLDGTIGSYFTSATTAAHVAEALEKNFTGSTNELAYTDIFATYVAQKLTTPFGTSSVSGGDSVVSGLTEGYYILLDKGVDGSGTLEDGDAYNKYIVQVSNNVSVTPKKAAPTMTKTANRNEGGTYTEAVSASIGDTVYFKLEGKLHDRMGDYKKYYYKVVDTLPAGLTFDSIASIGVFNVNNTDSATGDSTDYIPAADLADAAKLLADWGITVTAPAAGTKGGQVIIEFDDIKSVVEGLTGVAVEANDYVIIKLKTIVNEDIDIGLDDLLKPGNVNKVQLTYSNDPNDWANYKTKVGTTAEDTAYVYCYGVQIKKVNTSNTSEVLPGAKFVISRMEGTTTKYATVDANGVLTGWVTDIASATELVTDSSGLATITGLASGGYKIKETQAPAGFNNLPSDISLDIEAKTDTNNVLNSLSGKPVGGGTAAGDETTGLVTLTIGNSKGTVLPSTGGMGTTLFYALGGALMLGAAAVLVIKKRSEEK